MLNGSFQTILRGVVMPIGTPFTLAVSGNLTQGPLNFYIDGKFVRSVMLPADLLASSGNDKRLTFTNYSTGQTLLGKVDEVLVFDRILTSDEIAGLKF